MTIIFFLFAGILFTSCKSHRKFVNRNVPAGGSEKRPSTVSSASNQDLRVKYAQQMGVKESKITNMSLYAFIDEWYGVPYQYGGQSEGGVDCSGFVGNLYRDVYGKSIPRTTSLIEQKAAPISKSKLQEGNLVIFDIEGKKSSHIGVYLQNGRFVHASSSKGVIISDLSNSYYTKYFSRGGKL